MNEGKNRKKCGKITIRRSSFLFSFLFPRFSDSQIQKEKERKEKEREEEIQSV